MGTIIKSVAISKLHFSGIVKQITNAANHCMKIKRISLNDIGLLVSCGVYSEDYLTEPALAALIQNRLHKKQSPLELLSKQEAELFSFDLHNGGGGVLTAIQVVDGFLKTGNIENALVVAGDSKPTTGTNNNYSFSDSAGAILLSTGNSDTGFMKFRSDTYPEYCDDLESSTNWDSGNFELHITQKNDYLTHCLACVAKSINLFFKEEKLNWEQINLILTSQSPRNFEKEFQKHFGIPSGKIYPSINGEIYSAGIISSLNKTFKHHAFQNAHNILFITVGAGITVSLALYRNQ